MRTYFVFRTSARQYAVVMESDPLRLEDPNALDPNALIRQPNQLQR